MQDTDIIEIPPTMSKKEAQELMVKISRGANFDIGDIAVAMSKQKDSWWNDYKSKEGYVPKEYVGKEVGSTAYFKILDDVVTNAIDALKQAAEEHNKPDGWAEEVKNQKFYYAREVVVEADTHPKQKQMKRNKTMDRNSLTTSTTINQQLTRLKRQKDLSDVLDGLKGETTVLKEEVEGLKALTGDIGTDTDNLYEQLNISKLSKKEKASRMKAKGISQSAISRQLGIGIATVKRWWKVI